MTDSSTRSAPGRFCDWCGHERTESPCALCRRRYESARNVPVRDNTVEATDA